jgi:hypothetical protein
MKKIITFHAILISIGLMLCTGALAQTGGKWLGSGGWGAGQAYIRMYNPDTVQTLKGEVVQIDRITPLKGMCEGIHLLLKTEDETIAIHLGPAWFLERQDFPIDLHDQLEITGSRIDFEGKPALIAAEVKKKDSILKLRDESGFPLWSGWRQR